MTSTEEILASSDFKPKQEELEYDAYIDPVAFVRYASVYRQFQDVGEFIDEIQSLERQPIDPKLQPELFESGKSS